MNAINAKSLSGLKSFTAIKHLENTFDHVVKDDRTIACAQAPGNRAADKTGRANSTGQSRRI
jgi:hypothetical protein